MNYWILLNLIKIVTPNFKIEVMEKKHFKLISIQTQLIFSTSDLSNMKKDVKGDNLTSIYNILLCVIHNCTKVTNVMTWMSQSNLDRS